MLPEKTIQSQLPHVLSNTSFDFAGTKYEGKVRDCYIKGDSLFLITTDRLSCFDVVVTTIPFKGQVLNQMAVHWFELTKNVIKNHLLDVPDENVMVVTQCEVLPVEVVVRGYLAGSAWRDYQAGKKVSGVELPKGMRNSEKLPSVILTPSTKAAKGSHDEPISESEIISSGIVEKKLWEEVREVALKLFALGTEKAKEQGLILVDTKYEFGLKNGKLILVDEIHTLDSSRYWVASTYPEKFAAGQSPEMLDKEPVRQWLLSQGYKGDGKIPTFTDDYRTEISRHYISSFERITGKDFSGSVGDVGARIEKRLREWSILLP